MWGFGDARDRAHWERQSDAYLGLSVQMEGKFLGPGSPGLSVTNSGCHTREILFWAWKDLVSLTLTWKTSVSRSEKQFFFVSLFSHLSYPEGALSETALTTREGATFWKGCDWQPAPLSRDFGTISNHQAALRKNIVESWLHRQGK